MMIRATLTIRRMVYGARIRKVRIPKDIWFKGGGVTHELGDIV